MTTYQTLEVDDLEIFYREAGPPDAPTILLLHGFPSSSRMWEPLLSRLADAFHLVAPDYPGFGHSATPAPAVFAYPFDHIAEMTEQFTEKLQLSRYSLVMPDYGGPIGFRLALAHPERVQALVIQKAVAHEDGLGPPWHARRRYWDARAAHEGTLRENFFSPAATRLRHVGTSPTPERYDLDHWSDELAFLRHPARRTSRRISSSTTARTSSVISIGSGGSRTVSHRSWWPGASTTRPSTPPKRRRTAATSRTPRYTSSTPVISHWRSRAITSPTSPDRSSTAR